MKMIHAATIVGRNCTVDIASQACAIAPEVGVLMTVALILVQSIAVAMEIVLREYVIVILDGRELLVTSLYVTYLRIATMSRNTGLVCLASIANVIEDGKERNARSTLVPRWL